MKTCIVCKKEFPFENFNKRTYSSGNIGYQGKCKSCETIVKRQKYKPHQNIRKKLGITEEVFNELMLKENCDICGVTLVKKKCIDHCHATEKVRGVLCNNCNTALGLVKDNTEVLSNMISYINRR